MSLALEDREGLPDALRVLVERFPRDGWEAHPEFGPLTRFWLDRHLGFRRLLAALQADARGEAEALDPRRLSQLGGAFLNGLHEHHTVEDHHYFPKLIALAPELERGFGLLDADHHRLEEELGAFADGANAVLRGGGADALGRFGEGLARMEGFLDRHLTDEEDLVVPIILKMGEGRLG